MQSWNSRKSFLYFLTIMVMVLALALTGCSDDDDDEDEVEAADLENRTFIFDGDPDARFFRPALANLTARLDFGTQDANGDLPFSLSFNDPAGTELRGTATVGSPLSCPTAEAEQNDTDVPVEDFPITITGGVADVPVDLDTDLCEGIDVTFGDGVLFFEKDGVTVEFGLTGGTGSTAE
jgi:hypothetical protein